jgi:chorismate synthase
LGGISTGDDIYFKVAIKPVSTISKSQITTDYLGKETTLEAKGRHDPCVLPRAMPIIESMAAIVTIDFALIQLSRKSSVEIMEPEKSKNDPDQYYY